MATFTVTTFINRPLQEVFDFMTNPANFAQWQSGTKSAKWASEGPVGVGSIFHSVGQLLGREMKMERESNRRAGFTNENDRLPKWMTE